MSIWFKDYSLEDIKKYNEVNMMKHLDIQMTAIGDDFLEGSLPVDERTHQPFGILHGGANCVLAETLGSIASNLVVDQQKQHAVGLTIHTNHIKAVRNGRVKGVAKPKHLGKTTHVWEIKTYNDAGALTSDTTLTMAIINKLN
jgi:1,4-dihydroxy-2-naphthoyl-CoA hydrolase